MNILFGHKAERTGCPFNRKIHSGNSNNLVDELAQQQIVRKNERHREKKIWDYIKTNTNMESGRQKRGAENEKPSDNVTDGNTHSFTACLYHNTENSQPFPVVKQITAVDEYH